ncbi:TFC7 [Symbiodinium microadriaticum]|nr:TFC7 [Symbiodinium microadriaticum]
MSRRIFIVRSWAANSNFKLELKNSRRWEVGAEATGSARMARGCLLHPRMAGAPEQKAAVGRVHWLQRSEAFQRLRSPSPDSSRLLSAERPERNLKGTRSFCRPLSAAVISSPARRCLQTARPIAEALQAALYVEPGLADWSETRLPVQVPLPELGLEVRHLGPVWAEPLEEETWEMAVRRYRETYAGLVSISDPAVPALVLCSHQAALEALAPASWTQGHCAVTELSGIPPVPGSLLHDCSAWRLRFVFVASREPRPRYWRAKLGTPTRTRPLESHGDFWTVAAADVEAHLTVTSSKRERPLLLFFLAVTGELIHLSCGLAVSANEAGELTLAGAQRLRWSSGPGGELLNEKGVHLAVRNGEMPTLWMKEGSSDDSMAFDLLPLGKAGLGLGALADAAKKDSAS